MSNSKRASRTCALAALLSYTHHEFWRNVCSGPLLYLLIPLQDELCFVFDQVQC